MNETTDKRVKNKRSLYLNLTEIGYDYPFDYHCFVIYKTTEDEMLKEMIREKLNYILKKNKTGYFARVLNDFARKFEEEYY